MTTSKENYLKAIYDLTAMGQQIQVSQIAAKLGITRASVSRMLKYLRQEGLVDHQKYCSVSLTADGMKIARTVVNRNQLIQDFLIHVLGLDPDIAQKDACRIEHAMSPVTTLRLADYLQTLRR